MQLPRRPHSSSFVLIFGVRDALIVRNSRQSPKQLKEHLELISGIRIATKRKRFTAPSHVPAPNWRKYRPLSPWAARGCRPRGRV